MAELAVEAGHLDDDGDDARAGAGVLRDDALVTATIARHEAALLRTARRHSLCADDALDAYQRALVIFLERAGRLRRETAVNWLHQVVKHEAMAVRAQRQQLLEGADVDLDARIAEDVASPEERLLSTELTAHAVEAFSSLKPDEAQALWLKAQGLSYQEIAARQSWSYTKVNRAITEGRRSMRGRFARIESGAECERFAAVLEALAAGEADGRRLRELRPHLRRCRACRATVRELRTTRRPLGVFTLPPVVGWALRRLRGLVAQAAPATKAAVVVSSAVVVAGGAAAVHHERPPVRRPPAVHRVVRAASAAPVRVKPAVIAVPAAPRVAKVKPRRAVKRPTRVRRPVVARAVASVQPAPTEAPTTTSSPAPVTAAPPPSAPTKTSEFGVEAGG